MMEYDHKSRADYSTEIYYNNGSRRTEDYRNARSWISEIILGGSGPLYDEASNLDRAFWEAPSCTAREEHSMLDILNFYRRHRNTSTAKTKTWKRDEGVDWDERVGLYLIEHPEQIESVTFADEGMVVEARGDFSNRRAEWLSGNQVAWNVSGDDWGVIKTTGALFLGVYSITYREPSSEERVRNEVNEALDSLTGVALIARLAEIVRDAETK